MAKFNPYNQPLPTDRQIIRRINPDGTEYVAEGAIGADPTEAQFKCYAIVPIKNAEDSVIGSHLKHASGLFAPGWSGESLSSLAYLPVNPEE